MVDIELNQIYLYFIFGRKTLKDKQRKLRETNRLGKQREIDWENYTELDRFGKRQIDRENREVDWANRERWGKLRQINGGNCERDGEN